jgi:hypothetical protein
MPHAVAAWLMLPRLRTDASKFSSTGSATVRPSGCRRIQSGCISTLNIMQNPSYCAVVFTVLA